MENITKADEMITISKEEYDNLTNQVEGSKSHEMITISITEYETLKSQVEWLKSQLKLAKHKQFGASSEKSEPDDYNQLNLFNEAEVIVDETAKEEGQETVEVKSHHRKKTTFKERLPENLPVEVIEHTLPADECDCPECGCQMHAMGQEEREELKVIPAKMVIVKHVRKTYACRNCEKNEEYTPFKKAVMPEPVIKGSFAAPETVAYTMTQKFVMGLPLYRQEQEWNRSGIPISRQTLSNWFITAAERWLRPIYEELVSLLPFHKVLHADETTLQVLRELGKTPQSKSYMWLYRTSGDAEDSIILYEYQPGRKYEYPQKFLKDFSGYLHADGYEGYHNLPDNIITVGCWAHLRRKFCEVLKTLPEKERKNAKAYKGKQFCDKLFALERSFAKLIPEVRFEKRRELSKPIIDEFYAWVEVTRVLPKTPLGMAMTYAVLQRKYLENYLLDGRLEISNNRSERSMKTFAVDRKNFLFCNTVSGANASAVVFSLIETAKENGLLPFQYLSYVFKTAPNVDFDDLDEIKKLLPFRGNLPKDVHAPVSKKQKGFAWDVE